MRSLYISQTGMNEPLGQSQVIPYVVGLSRRGIETELISFEMQGTSPEALSELARRLHGEGILWRPLVRKQSHSLATKVYESGVGVVHALLAALRRKPAIVHARSYLPAAVADIVATVTPDAKLLFDPRGLLGDDYVDSGHWRRESTEYRILKVVEKRLFARANGVVLLTRAMRLWLEASQMLGAHTKTEVIPCCVDTQRFRPDPVARTKTRSELGLGNRVVVVYSGSLGGPYLETEMARFVGAMKRAGIDLVFLVVSPSNTDRLRAATRAEGLPEGDFVTLNAAPAEMPTILPAADLGLSFILPCFSKIGSSPTKVAEYLAAGVPVVLNGGVGDQADLKVAPEACVFLPSFHEDELVLAVAAARALAARSYEERSIAPARLAEEHFSLATGVARYERLYRGMVG